MGFLESISLAFKQTFVWRGRACRSEFWWFSLFGGLCAIPVVCIQIFLETLPAHETLIRLAAILFIAGINIIFSLASWALTVRRLHDRNRSAWVLFFPLIIIFPCMLLIAVLVPNESGLATFAVLAQGIVFIWWLYLMVQLILPGDPGENRFGPPRI